MKKSNYNIFVNRSNLTICYNSFTNTIIAVNNNVYEHFIKLDESEFEKAHPKHCEMFIKAGFLISEERNELDEIRLSHKQATFNDSRKCHIMIYPTQDCNLKCWYCYESHVYGSKMNDDVQERILKHLSNKIKNKEIDSLNITYFGGEPLMYFEKIAFPISYTLKGLCEQSDIKFSTFFITNGSLISEKLMNKLKLINPYFQITLDGGKDKHDKVRIGKVNNFPTYNKIINALNLITENLSSSFDNELRIVTLRINYDNDTLKSIDSLIEDIKHLDKKKVSIHLERVWQTKGQVDEEQDALLNSAIRKLSQAGFNVGIGIFGIKDYSCPAEKYDYAIINYNGNVYRCNGRNLTEETAEGELMPDGTIEWKANALSKRLGKTTFENPMCLSCQLLPACMGPCSQKCMERGWEDLAPVCSLNALDMSLDQYLSLWAEREFIRRKEEILQDSILNS